MLRRTFTALALAACTTASALAQDFPNRHVTLVMPFSAGGPGDTLARILGQGMTKVLGKQVIIENAAGAGSTIGAAKAASAKPDGHTVLMNHISHATNPALYRNLRYNTEADFEPIGLVADLPSAFVARKDFPANNFAEFLAYVKANKDKLNYGHAGTGSASHLCGLLFFSTIQTQVTTVPYKGTGPAMNDLMGGQIDFMCDQIVNVMSPIKGGKIKPYAVTSPARAEALPNLPSAAEAGLPGFEVNIWYAMFAPKGTPKPVIDKLVAALNEALKDPEVKSRFADLGAVAASPDRANPEFLRSFVKSEIERWGAVIRAAGVYAE
jgi:tripartite-type tricarboxylate transporter receptor subunit TctC